MLVSASEDGYSDASVLQCWTNVNALTWAWNGIRRLATLFEYRQHDPRHEEAVKYSPVQIILDASVRTLVSTRERHGAAGRFGTTSGNIQVTTPMCE